MLRSKRGYLDEIKNYNELNEDVWIKAFIPAIESLNLEGKLKEKLGDVCFDAEFSHWLEVSGDLLEKNSDAYNLMMELRERKGMKLELPQFDCYHKKWL